MDRHHLTDHISFRLLFVELNRIIQFKKIVIFIDEFDGIPVDELENFLTALRELYQKHKKVKQKALQILLKERNDHFDNLYEKAVLYKETFVEIVFDHVEYNPDDHDQTWLEQYGLVKQKESKAVVANNIYKARKYIIETKINRRSLTRTLNDGITQVSRKYLASESVNEGYLIVFDTKTPVGEDCEPRYHQAGDKRITSFTIAIGKNN